MEKSKQIDIPDNFVTEYTVQSETTKAEDIASEETISMRILMEPQERINASDTDMANSIMSQGHEPKYPKTKNDDHGGEILLDSGTESDLENSLSVDNTVELPDESLISETGKRPPGRPPKTGKDGHEGETSLDMETKSNFDKNLSLKNAFESPNEPSKTETVKKPRGRPPKARKNDKEGDTSLDVGPDLDKSSDRENTVNSPNEPPKSETGKKPRGRPPKTRKDDDEGDTSWNDGIEPDLHKSSSAENAVNFPNEPAKTETVKKPRGRPPKARKDDNEGDTSLDVGIEPDLDVSLYGENTKNPPNEPPKSETGKKRRGRPPKTRIDDYGRDTSLNGGKEPDLHKSSSAENAVNFPNEPAKTETVKKPRGRPPKARKDDNEGDTSLDVGIEPDLDVSLYGENTKNPPNEPPKSETGKKRRGRPPKTRIDDNGRDTSLNGGKEPDLHKWSSAETAVNPPNEPAKTETVKKPRGRPPKARKDDNEGNTALDIEPDLDKHFFVENAVNSQNESPKSETVEKPRGRPPKSRKDDKEGDTSLDVGIEPDLDVSLYGENTGNPPNEPPKSETGKKRRGRPPKTRIDDNERDTSLNGGIEPDLYKRSSAENAVNPPNEPPKTETVKKPRGRPPKARKDDNEGNTSLDVELDLDKRFSVENAVNSPNESSKSETGTKPRGRPPKARKENNEGDTSLDVGIELDSDESPYGEDIGNPPNEPPKSETGKKPRGRPPKTRIDDNEGDTHLSVGIEPDLDRSFSGGNAVNSPDEPPKSETGKKPRGRPPKTRKDDNEGDSSLDVEPDLDKCFSVENAVNSPNEPPKSETVKKPRGRPPKVRKDDIEGDPSLHVEIQPDLDKSSYGENPAISPNEPPISETRKKPRGRPPKVRTDDNEGETSLELGIQPDLDKSSCWENIVKPQNEPPESEAGERSRGRPSKARKDDTGVDTSLDSGMESDLDKSLENKVESSNEPPKSGTYKKPRGRPPKTGKDNRGVQFSSDIGKESDLGKKPFVGNTVESPNEQPKSETFENLCGRPSKTEMDEPVVATPKSESHFDMSSSLDHAAEQAKTGIDWDRPTAEKTDASQLHQQQSKYGPCRKDEKSLQPQSPGERAKAKQNENGSMVLYDRMPVIRKCEKCGEELGCDSVHECDRATRLVPMSTGGPMYAAHPAKELAKYIQDLKLKKDDIQWGSTFINDLWGQLKTFLNEPGGLFTWDIMPSGSYYEKLKVSKVNEFDVMLTTEIPVEIPEFSSTQPGYCSMEVKEKERYKDFLTEGKYLSPKAVKSYLEKKTPEVLRQLRTRQGSNYVMVESNKSPAITLRCGVKTLFNEEPSNEVYDVDLVPAFKIPRWPKEICRLGPNSEWLDNEKKQKIMKAPVYVVPKPAPDELEAEANTDKLWRVSMSAAEKELLFHADQGAVTVRKLVHKVMKKILEDSKEEAEAKHYPLIKKICSYHIKTLMLWQFEEHPNNCVWSKCPDMVRPRLKLAIKQFKNVLELKRLPHYFIRSPQLNLLADVPDEQIKTLCFLLQEFDNRF